MKTMYFNFVVILLLSSMPMGTNAQKTNQHVDENLIPFNNAQGKWGYLDAKTLTVKIEPQYGFAHLFKNGVAEVGLRNPNAKSYHDQNLYGLIDATGKELFKPRFPRRYDVKINNDSLVPELIEYVNTKGQKGIAKTDGTWLISMGKYEQFRFYAKTLIVADQHVIIHNGRTVELPNDVAVKWIDQANGWLHFKKGERYEGVTDLRGNIIVPAEYIDVQFDAASKRFLASKPKHKLTKSNALKLLRRLVDSNDQKAVTTDLLDKNGQEIAHFKSRYEPVINEKTGTAHFKKNGKRIYFSLKTGKIVSRQRVIGQTADYFVFEKHKLKGVKNSAGKVQIPAKYPRLKFLDPTTLIATNAKTYKEGLIGLNGKTVLPFTYRSIYKSGFGILTAEKDGFGLITKSGKVLTDFRFQNGIYLDDNGFATVYENGKHGVVDSTGSLVVPVVYDDIFNTHIVNDTKKAYFEAEKNGKWGVLDDSGKILVPFKYGNVSFSKRSEASGWVGTEDLDRKKNGALNLKTGVEIPTDYNSLRFHKNFIIASHYKDGDYSYDLLDQSGARITDANFSSLNYKNGYLEARRNGKYGIISTKGKVLIPLKYDYIWAKTKDLIMVKKDHRLFYMNLDGKKYLPKP